MKEIEVDPHEIGIWIGYIKVHEEPLELIIKREGWKNILRVPIFELPKGYNHKYVLIDGHARHDAAIKTRSLLPCNLYTQDEPIDIVKDKLAPFKYQDKCSKKGFYEKIFALYIIYEKS